MPKNSEIDAYAIPLSEYPVIGRDESVYTGIKMLKEALHKDGPWQGKRLLMVRDRNGEPTGLLTVKCIFNALGLRLLDEDPAFKEECFSWHYIHEMRGNARVTVREIMRPLGAVSIRRHSSISAAARLFARHRVNHLPVTDGGKATGILDLGQLFYKYHLSGGFRQATGTTPHDLPLLVKLLGKFAST
ncbi:CBS domain containing protein [Desulfocucumis palustris]|uniref:CBS domain containing protein n=1 Tax=Desulfocucumis palustris TaxID=1898651 RepID=A0A2L2XAZ0_9FIRM|nr:CBS domain-containing protein [Desulfocucumis palustris]GBF33270.1 CBS domain containing protein [Desulfocucumis palustris]